jgi:SOS-response transcriptional repressor LexA
MMRADLGVEGDLVEVREVAEVEHGRILLNKIHPRTQNLRENFRY